MKRLLLLILPIFLYSNPFKTTLQDEMQWLEEETFVVSASRIKENIKKTAASVSVIDEEMIEKMGANTLMDLLSTVSGMNVTQSEIFLKELESRGIKDFTSKQILFMIDGHSIDSILLNGGATAILSNMPIYNIKRIEIIKGPASALYGANAFTGLINIITKKADDIDGVIVNSKIASYNTKELNILYGKSFKDLSINANLNIHKTDGHSVFIKKDSGGKSAHTDPTLEQLKADLKLEYKDFYFSSMYLKRDDGSNFGPLGEISNKNNPESSYLYTELGFNKNLTSDINLSSRVYFDRYEIDNEWHLQTIPAKLDLINGLKNEKQGIEVLGTFNLNNNFTSILGSTYEKHKQYDVETIVNGFNVSGTNSSFAPNVDRNMWALYLNNLYDINEDLRFTFGIRYDNYSDFGSNTAPRGGISWQIDKNNILKLMYGEGFRTPTFAEAYNVSEIIEGNTKLTTEKVKTYELSYENNSFDNLTTKLTYFNNQFTNLISQNGNIYENKGEVETTGFELETRYNLTRGSYIAANYTYQRAKDKITNTNLPNISKHKANIFLNYRINKYLNSFNHLQLIGSRQRDINDTRKDEVSGYAILNTSLQAKNFYKNLELKLSVNNLFDKLAYDPSKIYMTYDDYGKRGRNFMLEMKYTF